MTKQLYMTDKLPLSYNNTQPSFNINCTNYIIFWQNLDMQQVVGRYVWDGLPNGITSWNLERMLYHRGALCGFTFAGKIYILPYAIQGQINPYGLPNAVRPISYNGQGVDNDPDFFSENFSLDVDNGGNEDLSATAHLLFDSVPQYASTACLSKFSQNMILINEIVDLMKRIAINVTISSKKLNIIVKDAKSASVIESSLIKAFGSDAPFNIMTSEFEVSQLQQDISINANELFEIMANYNNLRLQASGIQSSTFNQSKSERVSSNDIQGLDTQIKIINQMGLELRQLFCEKMNSSFGLNISVKLREEDFEEKTDMNNMTNEEEIKGGDARNE